MNILTGPFSMPVILQMKCQLGHILPRTERERGEIVTTFQLSHSQHSASCLMTFQLRIVWKADMSSYKKLISNISFSLWIISYTNYLGYLICITEDALGLTGTRNRSLVKSNQFIPYNSYLNFQNQWLASKPCNYTPVALLLGEGGKPCQCPERELKPLSYDQHENNVS